MCWLLAVVLGVGGPALAGPEPGLHPELVEQSRLFERAWLSPAPGVHVAVGYALANVIVLEGPEGLVVVDTTEGATPAREVLRDLRARTDKPIAAIVFTHNHADHVFGSGVFAAEAPDAPIWAHRTTERRIDEIVNVLRDAIQVRSMRMFGSYLPADRGTGDGIGFRLRFHPEDIDLARPTQVFDEHATVEAGGITLELHHAPGETDDQLLVWWPERKILLPADNIYQAFPNLYTIRGTRYRDLRSWVDALDQMRDLQAEVLVPQHTRPVVGRDDVAEVLTAYRDAIQYVHDQTIRGINKGRTPDQLAHEVVLPPHLANHPWLREHYGRVSWSVRSVYAGTLGWFDGRAAGLDPIDPAVRAQRLRDAFAASETLEEHARKALAEGDAAWAAELAQIQVDAEPKNKAAARLLADALEALGDGHINANAVNWTLTEAGEHRGTLDVHPAPPDAVPVAFIDSLPVDAFMRALPTRLKAEKTLDADWVAVFDFTDVDAHYVMHVRRGVAEMRQRPVEVTSALEPDLRIRTTAMLWKRIAAGHAGAPGALARGDLKLEGGLGQLTKLQKWLER